MLPDELSHRLWVFAAGIGKLVDALPETRLGRHVAGQLVRSGTAAAPNYDEGRAGESRADFVHKINIALKELVETRGWLQLTMIAELLPAHRVNVLFDECQQLCRILGKSVSTARANTSHSRGLQTTNSHLPILN